MFYCSHGHTEIHSGFSEPDLGLSAYKYPLAIFILLYPTCHGGTGKCMWLLSRASSKKSDKLHMCFGESKVFSPSQIPTLLSYSNAFLTDFYLFSYLENSYLLRNKERREKLLLSLSIFHKFKVLGTHCSFWYQNFDFWYF